MIIKFFKQLICGHVWESRGRYKSYFCGHNLVHRKYYCHLCDKLKTDIFWDN